MDPLRPFEVLEIFGGKSKSNAPKAFKFSTKRVPIEVNNWWKFGIDISNHFWEIQNWIFCLSNSFPIAYRNNFQKLFLYTWEWIGKTKFWIIWRPGVRISYQKCLQFQMGVFEPHPQNLEKIHFSLTYSRLPNKRTGYLY